ncbi:MAG TPA: ribonuclease HII [Candidatus Protoclostridium stercorigallinarum]|uniref:Ribonuclease HII n=1 Tax=Candidatus Protoclostridium stercorigallinarum TaxID=2838741 RepID=A0A9D1TSZ3_9FIRM|nr:ribonuclease HII [Candidatus Protoclostridium stercorigallinarum]
MSDTRELYTFDETYGGCVAGVDEAGRGPLAGPVTVACCIPGKNIIDGVNDSKKLSEKKREELYEKITASAISWSVVSIDENVIDEINILAATKLGMEKCVKALDTSPNIVLIDAVKGLDLPYRCESIVKADAKSYAVACASIIAKVTRDRFMRKADELYPMYGFAKHKGYGTAEHIAAIQKFGPCELHRRTFIRKFIDEQT